jgi:hypothetical protein
MSAAVVILEEEEEVFGDNPWGLGFRLRTYALRALRAGPYVFLKPQVSPSSHFDDRLKGYIPRLSHQTDGRCESRYPV